MIIRRIANAFRKQDWFVVFIEIVIVVIGVYIGIFLGDIQEAQKFKKETDTALQAFESELRSDLVRLDEIIEVQTITVAAQLEVIDLLGEAKLDEERINADFDRIIVINDTFFPNRSAYNAMEGGGYLAALPDAELRLQITRLVEREYTRTELNGAQYDNLGFILAMENLVGIWDRAEKKLLPGNPNGPETLRTAVIGINGQGNFYLNFIRDTLRPQMVKTLAMIDAYQGEGGQ